MYGSCIKAVLKSAFMQLNRERRTQWVKIFYRIWLMEVMWYGIRCRFVYIMNSREESREQYTTIHILEVRPP